MYPFNPSQEYAKSSVIPPPTQVLQFTPFPTSPIPNPSHLMSSVFWETPVYPLQNPAMQVFEQIHSVQTSPFTGPLPPSEITTPQLEDALQNLEETFTKDEIAQIVSVADRGGQGKFPFDQSLMDAISSIIEQIINKRSSFLGSVMTPEPSPYSPTPRYPKSVVSKYKQVLMRKLVDQILYKFTK
jgi:hypothetical protein